MGGLYQSQILILPSLSINRYENIFKLYNDDDDKMFYNLNTSVTFPDNIDPEYIDTFQVR